jgi:hypothetical protein
MTKKKKRFLKHLWHDAESIASELCVYVLILAFVFIASPLLYLFCPPELFPIVHALKKILIVSVLGLLTVRTICTFALRVVKSLRKEAGSALRPLKSGLENSPTKNLNKPSASEEFAVRSDNETLLKATRVKENTRD